jgi:predicted Na+-dependent transporter
MDIWFLFSVISLAIAAIAIFIGGFMAFFMDNTPAERRRSWKKFKPVIISLFATFLIFMSLGYVFMDISSQLPA